MDDAAPARPAATQRPPLAALPPRNWRAAAADLERDGVVMLRGALTPAALARIEDAVAFSFANPSASARQFYPGDAATFFEDRGMRHAEAAREAGLSTMLAELWGVGQLWYLGEQLFLKEGGEARRTPWHQDTSYLRMMGSQLVACWISLDPLPKHHALEFVRGSHKGVLFNGSAFAEHDDTAPLYRRSPLPRLPDIQGNRNAFDIVAWDVEPGDVIIFHLGVLHGGAGTVGALRRRTISMRFLGPDVVFDGRVRDNQGAQEGNDAAMAGVYAGRQHGDPFPTAHLPQV
jgi:hypothetical protein